jgi:hypothetical protein
MPYCGLMLSVKPAAYIVPAFSNAAIIEENQPQMQAQ